MSINPKEAALQDLWQTLTTREGDELVAQHVFRWGRTRIPGPEELPPFSSDLTAAWQVVDAFPDLRFTLERFETGTRISAFFRDVEGRSAFEAFMHMGGDIAPSAAICMAGLLAAGFNPVSE